MRALALMVVLVAGCPAQPDFAGDHLGSGSSSLSDAGFGSGMAPAQCLRDQDCAAVGAKCCDCPTYAVPTTDPADVACNDVVCDPAPTCPGNVHAACDTGRCVLACTSMVCPASCPQGYALDADGCLTCACAQIASPQCASDPDCVETRADCCGCALGGTDTAVPASQQATFDLGLHCPANPACPDVNTCEPGYAARCVQGGCELTTATPSGACGRDDLVQCPSGQVCTINVNHAASMQGLGVCQPPT